MTERAREDRFHVHKFGGTSLGSKERIENAADIVSPATTPLAVVVSAMSGVTDGLIALLERAKGRDGEMKERFVALIEKHRETARALLGADTALLEPVLEMLRADAADLDDILRATWLLQSYSEETLEYVSGHGELWSARMLAALLQKRGVPAAAIDARDVIVVEHEASGPVVHWKRSSENMARVLEAHPEELLVVTGYIARTPNGTPTTLKRNGSDFSASIVGNLLDASAITIWTDVDGVLSADPRKVPEAVVTPELSYDEAAELAYFGAKVIHPHTMAPAIEKSIPIYIRNSLRPEAPGSCIHHLEKGAGPSEHPVVGFASVDRISLINVEGTGMMGVPGVAERMFRALSDVGVSVVMISQASSEHSICIAVPDMEGEAARSAVERAFYAELEHGQVERVDRIGPCSILAAVGDRMAETPGVAGRFLSALGRARVNVRAAAQGSSERNISVVVDERDAEKGLRAAHAAFYLSDQTLSLGLVGPGLIGKTLLAQLETQAAVLKSRFNVELRVRGITDSKRMVLDDTGIPLGEWQARLAEGEPADLSRFAAHVGTEHLPHSVIVDCTASDAIAAHTEAWLRAGIHVVTPNKKACAGDLARYQRIGRARREKGTHFFYEATVGAGLPILSTLRDLLNTGDSVLSVEGVLSGTLSYLFNTFDGKKPFSTLVKEAREMGYTEPDPRDDLSGTDVARKVVILAREMGRDLSLADIPVESLVPEALAAVPDVDTFLARLADYDEEMVGRLNRARADGGVLRYVGVIDESGKARVELRTYRREHPFGGLSGADNILAFTTARYRARPLIVQGPGAGPEVTAGGVFSDLLRLAAHLGARS